jgi:hypothetical protein
MGHYLEERRIDFPTKSLSAAAWIWLGSAWDSGSTVLAPSGACPHRGEAWGPSLDLPAFHMTIANDNGGHPWRLSLQLFLGFRRNSKTRAVGLAIQQDHK